MPRRETQHSLWHPAYEGAPEAPARPERPATMVLNERKSNDEVSLSVQPQESV